MAWAALSGRWLLGVVLSVGLAVSLSLPGCGAREPEGLASSEEVAVKVGLVGLDSRNLPVVVLEEEGGPRALHIWIGVSEARSIASEMEERSAPRPNSHDLTKRVILGLDGSVERVVVSDLREGTFYAILSLRRHGELVEIDARPSDAIAIALRTRAAIFVRAPVFDAAGGALDEGEEGKPIESDPEISSGETSIGI